MDQQSIDTPELLSCAAKLARAEQRLQDYTTRIMKHRETKPYRLIRDEQTGAGNYIDYVYRVEVAHPPPLEASLIIGEFLYNVHSALDHLANRLAEREGHTGRVTFPIFKNRAKFWRKDPDGTYNGRSGAARLMLMPKDAWPLIEAVQPYKRGGQSPGHPLWLLHELSNADKHHALHIVGAALTKTRFSASGQDTLSETRYINYGGFDDRDEIARLRIWITGPNPKPSFHHKFATTEAFAETGPAPGQEPSQVLLDIFTYVIEEVFARRFLPYFRG